MFLQWHSKVFAHALGRGLIVKSLYYFFAALEWRRARWREKETRRDAADDGAVEIVVVGQIGQDGIATHSAPSELERALAKSFLQFIEVEIVPATGIADNDDRFGLDFSPNQRPKIFVIVQGWTITNRATINFPCGCRGNDNDRDDDRDAAPRYRRDRALEFQGRSAVHAFGFGWLPEK